MEVEGVAGACESSAWWAGLSVQMQAPWQSRCCGREKPRGQGEGRKEPSGGGVMEEPE